MTVKRKLVERFETSDKKPESMLWGNGTTDHRFDLAGNTFVDPDDRQKAGQIDPMNPMFLTHDVDYILKYVKSHISKDYKVDSSQEILHAKMQNDHGLIVFAKIKSGLRLFDFSDENDFKKVFGEKDSQAIALIFKEAEPYFAFNTAVTNAYKHYEPIEFSIAKRMAVYLAIDRKWKDDANKVPIESFFISKNQSFIQIFTQADESLFDKTITKDLYLEFLDFYKKTLVGAELKKSQTGRDQLVKWGQIWKIYPNSLDASQLAKLNGYFKLLKFCVQYRELLSDPKWFSHQRYQKVLDNTDPKKRSGFVDLLQVCLYVAIDQAGFSGFWCPEHLGKKTIGLSNNYQSIAVFNRSDIEEYKAYSFAEIQKVLSYMEQRGQSTTNLVLQTLRDGIESKKKVDDEAAAVAAKAEAKAAAEIKMHKDNGEHYVDDAYLQQLQKAVGKDHELWKVLKSKAEQSLGQWVKTSPNEAVIKARKFIDDVRRKQRDDQYQELQWIQRQLDPRNIRRLSVFQIEQLRTRQRALNLKLKTKDPSSFNSNPFSSLR